MAPDMTELIDEPIVAEEISPPAEAPTRATSAATERADRSRIVRRPRNWLDAPWTNERIARYLTALIIVGGSTFAVLKVVHLNLVFENNTPTGGDMGAHVMAPAYLRDNLLPHFQLSGWSNYWYDGFPMYRFYMVVPALMIVALNLVFPYGVAFKLIAILGLVTLPVCCWAFGRLARFRYPMPELMALAATVFLFDESFSIYGGNVKSTMAGEFSFSIALSFAILGLGVFARGMETGKYPQLGGDPHRVGDAVPRHRAVVRDPRGRAAVGRVDGPHQVHLRLHRARRCGVARARSGSCRSSPTTRT